LIKLALAELGCASCGFEAVFLTLFHSRVTSEEARCLQGCAEALVDKQESSRYSVTDCAGLTGNAAACDGSFDIHLAEGIGCVERLTNEKLQGLKTEVIVNVASVYRDPVPYI